MSLLDDLLNEADPALQQPAATPATPVAPAVPQAIPQPGLGAELLDEAEAAKGAGFFSGLKDLGCRQRRPSPGGEDRPGYSPDGRRRCSGDEPDYRGNGRFAVQEALRAFGRPF